MAVIRLHQNRINPLVLPVIFAKELGIFEKNGVEVDLRLADNFIFRGKEEFLNKEVDAVMGDTTFFFDYLEANKEVTITSTLTRTIQIVKKKEAKVSQLNVGVNRNGLFRFFVDTFLADELKEACYTWINNTYERMEAMKQGKINALVAIDPFIGQVLREQEAEVYWHSNQVNGTFVMWCFDADFVKQYPEEVKNFHQSLEEAASLFNRWSKEEKIANCQTLANYSEKAAQEFSNFLFEPQTNYAEKDFELLQNWLVENHEIAQLYSAKEHIFETF